MPACEMWLGCAYPQRANWARSVAAETDCAWGILSPVRGVLHPLDVIAPHGVDDPPPEYGAPDWARWCDAVQGGLSSIVELDHRLCNLRRLSIDVHGPTGWSESVARALGGHRVRWPAAGLASRDVRRWYAGAASNHHSLL